MDTQPLNETQLEQALKELNVAWSSIPGQGLVRVFDTGSFSAGVELIVRLAKIAEAQDHNPDVRLTPEDVEVTLTTPSAGGVTEQDIQFAKIVDHQLT
jgi:4a-hydroxytetrahydrobiopterin dehydratase